jgi:predicted lipid-binding transport protein (Tim44 family)
MIDKLLSIDKTFNEGMFITKVNNIFIMLHSAIMMDDLDRVRHYISGNLEIRYEQLLSNLRDRNERQMYDELNVKTTEIKSVIIDGDKAIIHVDLVSRYMDYIVDKNTGEYKSGNNTSRIEKMNHLTFEKMISSNYSNSLRKCPTCGASVDINKSGKCEYCGSIFNTEKHDWTLTNIETV